MRKFKIGRRVTWIHHIPTAPGYSERIGGTVVNFSKTRIKIRVANPFGRGYLYRWVRPESLIARKSR